MENNVDRPARISRLEERRRLQSRARFILKHLPSLFPNDHRTETFQGIDSSSDDGIQAWTQWGDWNNSWKNWGKWKDWKDWQREFGCK
jgi:hypothetical protein